MRGRFPDMPVSRRSATIVFALLLAVSLSAADGVIRGEVTDASGGVLPGVTVTATTTDGRVVGTAVTDGVGRYAIKALPIGAITLTFQLDGFDSATVSVNVTPGVEARVVERLRLAQVTENVVVVAEAPEPPSPYVPTPRPQRYAIVPVPLQDLETICLPSKPGTAAESIAR